MSTAMTAQILEERQLTLLQTMEEAAYVTETDTGLIFAENTPIEVWGAFTERLIRQHKRIEWAIGDAIVFGGRKYRGMYEQWVNETGLSENTLSTMRWVAERIESSRRRKDVGWSHHREVAALPPEEQEAMLDIAADQGMTRFELRQAVKAHKEDQNAIPADSAPTPTCAADGPWQPTPDDLLPEHRAAMQAAALHADLSDPRGFAAGALWMAQYTASEALFIEGRWRDVE